VLHVQFEASASKERYLAKNHVVSGVENFSLMVKLSLKDEAWAGQN
jgi:hypothetical protein